MSESIHFENNAINQFIHDVLYVFELEPQPIEHIIKKLSRNQMRLNKIDRKKCLDAIFDIIRWKCRIDSALLSNGIKVLSWKNRIAYYMSEKCDRALLVDMIDSNHQSPEELATYYSLPEWLWQMICKSYGIKRAKSIAESMYAKASPCLRVNTLHYDRDALIKKYAAVGINFEKTTYSPFGLCSQSHLSQGLVNNNDEFIFQDEGSQLIAWLAIVLAKKTVVDACAGKGGKTLSIAMSLDKNQSIIATDVDKSRLRHLKQRNTIFKFSHISIHGYKQLSTKLLPANVVLLDVPCSGTGTLRRCPDLKWRLDACQINDYRQMQLSILNAWSMRQKSGDYLIYATCSLLSEENEDVVHAFLKQNSHYSIIPVSDVLSLSTDQKKIICDNSFLKTCPDHGSWDGFFAAVLQRC